MRTRRGLGSRLPLHLPRPSHRLPTRFTPDEILRSTRSPADPHHSDLIDLPTIRLPVPRDTITLAAKLLDQQFWCWGQDVIHPKRNALLDFGFMRYASPPEKKQISHYVLAEVAGPTIKPRSGRRIGLWGSGLFYGHREHGAIYIRRYTLAPVYMDFLCPIELIGAPDEFPSPPPQDAEEKVPHVVQLLGNLCQWLAHYEAWAQLQLGRKHRERCLRDWKKTIASAAEMVPEWQRLGSVFQHIGISEMR
jgi:hypothetical protein